MVRLLPYVRLLWTMLALLLLLVIAGAGDTLPIISPF